MKLYLDGERLVEEALQHREQYASAAPFPHIVIDGLLPAEALEQVLADFPRPDSKQWKAFENYHERKLMTQGEKNLSVFTSLFLYQFNTAPFVQFLERLTGINGLIPDPHFHGGGLHQITRGGKLAIHADFNRQPELRLDRRLNVLVYLNKDWQEEYGGHLELWDRSMTKCEKKIAPLFNRMVVFSTTDWAYHGHPEPLTCPEDRTRKSIALYYYTNGRPEGEVIPRKNTTQFMQRPGDPVAPIEADGITAAMRRRGWRFWLTRLTPPILLDAAKGLRPNRSHKGAARK